MEEEKRSAMDVGDNGKLANWREDVVAPGFFDMLLQRVADGETLREVAKSRRLPYGPLSQWIIEDGDRADLYARALQFAAGALAHETVAIADRKAGVDSDDDPAGRKLQIQTRQWLAARLHRERYGEHTKLDVKVERPSLDRERMLLEAARNVAWILTSADQAKREREALALPAPVSTEAEGAI